MYHFIAVCFVIFCGLYLIKFHPKKKSVKQDLDDTEKFYH